MARFSPAVACSWTAYLGGVWRYDGTDRCINRPERTDLGDGRTFIWSRHHAATTGCAWRAGMVGFDERDYKHICSTWAHIPLFTVRHDAMPFSHASKQRDGAQGEALYQVGNTRASYFHAYFPSDPAMVARLFLAE